LQSTSCARGLVRLIRNQLEHLRELTGQPLYQGLLLCGQWYLDRLGGIGHIGFLCGAAAFGAGGCRFCTRIAESVSTAERSQWQAVVVT
jgi:hypothetical protein